jgi:hypothetical protein
LARTVFAINLHGDGHRSTSVTIAINTQATEKTQASYGHS